MTTTTQTGYGPTRRTRQSAQREADRWTASGDGAAYEWNAPSSNIYDPSRPTYVETVVAEVQAVEGGWACAYITTRVIEEA